MSEFTLREAGPPDAPEVWRLVRGLAEYERMLARFTATEAGLAHLLFGPRPIAHAVLAEAAGRAVGIALWYFTLSSFTARPILFLEDIFVEPEHRKHGIGLALLRHLAGIAAAENCFSMDWNVLDWNRPALDFYQSLGARPVGDWLAMRLDATAVRAIAMTEG